MSPEEKLERLARLKAAIAASGLSRRQFAHQVMVRHNRTVQRWLAGGPIPDDVDAWLRSHSPKVIARIAKVAASPRSRRTTRSTSRQAIE